MSIDFYYERQVLEQDMREQGDLEADEIIGFGFMENYSVLDEKDNEIMIPGYLGEVPLTYADFLHGYCSFFALRLHNEYGYKIENLYEDDGDLIHSFCRTKDGKFVDVRGVTDDAETFFSEFDSMLNPKSPFSCKCSSDVPKIENEFEKKLYEYTKHILRESPSVYTTVA